MANTKIQIKRSSVTSTPAGSSLSAAEPAYSYSSNTLFIGGSDGVGVLPIGGLYYVNLANTTANNLANVAISANSYAGYMANSANIWASANIQFSVAGANNYAGVMANSVNANIQYSVAGANNYAGVMANSVNANVQYSVAGANNYAGVMANSANSYAGAMANAANSYTSATYYLKSGGTISGDVAITGNLTISGNTTYANTQQLLIGDNIITLNADLPLSVAPTENAGIEVNRGNKNSNAAVTWIETTGQWGFTGNNLNAISTFIASNTLVETYAAAGNSYASIVAANNALGANTWANTKVAAIANVAGRIWANAVTTSGLVTYTVDLAPTGVVATTYGGATQIPYVTVDAYGRVTTAGNVAVSFDLTPANNWANTTAQNWANTRLANVIAGAGQTITWTTTNGYTNATIGLTTTGVSSGTYGTDNVIPVYVVDSYGRLTSASNVAINATAISVGTLPVARGGTGNTTFTANGILFGNGTSPVQVTAAGTDGQVLQVSGGGIPSFGMLDGGTF